MSSAKTKQLISEIGSLTVLELAQFIKDLESEFGVSAAMPTMAAAPASASSEAPAAKAEEKSEYKVELTSGGSDKIKTIKALRSVVSSFGLSEAKKAVEDAAEGTPTVIAEAASKDDAKKIKEALEAAGATVKLS